MLTKGKIINRKRDHEGNLVGKRSNDSLANTAVYEVEFTSGEIREYMANTLVEAMMADCDEEGKKYLLLESIFFYNWIAIVYYNIIKKCINIIFGSR